MYKKLFQSFVKTVKNSNNIWMIPQQRGAQPFDIKVVAKNQVLGFEVEHRVMPIDTFFPIELFNFVIAELFQSPTKSLERGNGLKNRIGGVGMGINTIESKVAIRFYAKRRGQFVDRRISVIANILVESGVCEHGKGILRLKNIGGNFKSGNNPIGINNPKNTPKKPIGTNDKDLPEYLIKNKNKIIDNPDQFINLINKNYGKEIYMEFDVIKEFHERFPNLKKSPIQRKQVSDLFKNKEYYLGFIAAMIWGGINASRPRKVKKSDKENNEIAKFETIDFYKLLKQNPIHVAVIIKQVEKYIIQGKNKECFEYLLSDNGKLQGVGYAYFTKLMYFLGHHNPLVKTKPLIFDKWTSNAYFALLIDSNQVEKINQFYTKSIDPKYKTVGLTSLKSSAYNSYINDMKIWANKLGVSASKLEEFIFGISLRKNNTKTNPRNQLWNKILEYPQIKIKKVEN
jgi:hypothetical protein